ncbi:MAG: preprotein translocase subunit SecE [Candidatus Endobugula sp.]
MIAEKLIDQSNVGVQVNAKVESGNNSLNAVKWLVAAALVAIGVVGNSYYSDLGLLYRVAALLVMGAIIFWVAVNTTQGAMLWSVVKESQTEIRKVVWPTRQETNQTALIVVVLTVIMAFILWGLDTFIGWIASLIIG